MDGVYPLSDADGQSITGASLRLRLLVEATTLDQSPTQSTATDRTRTSVPAYRYSNTSDSEADHYGEDEPIIRPAPARLFADRAAASARERERNYVTIQLTIDEARRVEAPDVYAHLSLLCHSVFRDNPNCFVVFQLPQHIHLVEGERTAATDVVSRCNTATC